MSRPLYGPHCWHWRTGLLIYSRNKEKNIVQPEAIINK